MAAHTLVTVIVVILFMELTRLLQFPIVVETCRHKLIGSLWQLQVVLEEYRDVKAFALFERDARIVALASPLVRGWVCCRSRFGISEVRRALLE